MWKKIGSVHSGDDKSMRSNRSRIEIQMEPFHQSLKRRSNISPETNRSFCQDYFQRHKANTLNISSYSNKSEKNLKTYGEKDDMFTEMRQKGSKEHLSSKVESVKSLKDNPEGDESKGRSGIKKLTSTLRTLKKDHNKLKNKMEKDFNGFKNFFYQLEEQFHQVQTQDDVPMKEPEGQKVDEELIKDIMIEAMDVEKYFAEMDRKKAQIMQELTI